MNTIGEKLKTIRKEKDLTQAQLGDIIGFTKQAICNVENGLSNPSLEFISKLIVDLNVNANWLIAGIGSAYIANAQEYENIRSDILSEVEEMLRKRGI